MIELSLEEFMTAALAVAFVVCGVGSVWWRLAERRGRAAVRHDVIRCRYCATFFPREGGHRTEECPKCRMANHAGRDRRLG